MTLLHPLCWGCTLCPLLPPQLLAIVEAPTPYFMGCSRSHFRSQVGER